MDMKKASSKKTKILIIAAASLLALVICLGVGAFIWYKNSPFPTVRRLLSAWEERDMDAALACIEPEASQKIELLLRLTGLSAEDLINTFQQERTQGDASAGNASLRFAGYEQTGDHACITLETAEETAIAINFVRISGAWYLSLS